MDVLFPDKHFDFFCVWCFPRVNFSCITVYGIFSFSLHFSNTILNGMFVWHTEKISLLGSIQNFIRPSPDHKLLQCQRSNTLSNKSPSCLDPWQVSTVAILAASPMAIVRWRHSPLAPPCAMAAMLDTAWLARWHVLVNPTACGQDPVHLVKVWIIFDVWGTLPF